MERIDERTVKMTPDERILSNFYSYLREEEGLSRPEAFDYLHRTGLKTEELLTNQLMDHADGVDEEPTVAEQVAAEIDPNPAADKPARFNS